MTRAGFHHDRLAGQPGSWLSAGGIAADLMVPDAIAEGVGSSRIQDPGQSGLLRI
jgi:hypothetical protein